MLNFIPHTLPRLLIRTYLNKFADDSVMYAVWVDEKGKRKCDELDNLKPVDDEDG